MYTVWSKLKHTEFQVSPYFIKSDTETHLWYTVEGKEALQIMDVQPLEGGREKSCNRVAALNSKRATANHNNQCISGICDVHTCCKTG